LNKNKTNKINKKLLKIKKLLINLVKNNNLFLNKFYKNYLNILDQI